MSRPLRDTENHRNANHRSADGTEMNAADIPLPAPAAAFTIADTVEAWLEAMQLQINAHLGTTLVLASQLGGLWQDPIVYQDQTATTYQPDAQQGAGSQLLP